MGQSYNPLKITGKEPDQDSCHSSPPQFLLNPLLHLKDPNDLYIQLIFFQKPLPSSLPTVTCTESKLVHITLLLAKPMGTRFLFPSSPESLQSRGKPYTHGRWQSLNRLEIPVALSMKITCPDSFSQGTWVHVMTPHLYTCLQIYTHVIRKG